MATNKTKTLKKENMKTSDENKIKEIIKRQMVELIEKSANLDQIKESIFKAWNNEYPEVLESFLG